MMDVEQPPVASEPLRPLGRLAMLMLPILKLVRHGADRERLNRRAVWTRELMDRAAVRKLENGLIEKEAQDFWQVIEGCYIRMGLAHLPTADHQSASGANKKKIQPVRVERCYFNETRIYYKILTRRKTLFGTKNALPYLVYIGDLIAERTLQELSWQTQRVVTSEHDDPRYGVWIIVNRAEGVGGLRTKVLFKEMLSHYPLDMSSGMMVLGLGNHNAVHSATLAEHPHVLIAGSTKSGKSNMLNQLLSALMIFTDPKTLKFILIDLKRMEFKLFRKAGHLYCPVVTEAESALEVMREMVREIERRSRLMEDTDVKEIGEWNAQYPSKALPRIICVIDEFAELRLTENQEVSEQSINLVKRISNIGRACGIHLWVCTQRPATKVLGNDIKINMPLIIAGRTQSKAQSAVILDKGDAALLPLVPGRMIYQSGSEQHEIQTPFIDVPDIKRAVAISRGRAEGIITIEGIDPVIVPEGLIPFVARQGGSLSVALVDELLGSYAITKAMYRAFTEDLIDTGGAVIDGNKYVVVRKGNHYSVILEGAPEEVIIEQPAAAPVLTIAAPPEDEIAGKRTKALEAWKAANQEKYKHA